MSDVLLINKKKKLLKHGDKLLKRKQEVKPSRDYFYVKVKRGDNLHNKSYFSLNHPYAWRLLCNIVYEGLTYDENNFGYNNDRNDISETVNNNYNITKNCTIYFRCFLEDTYTYNLKDGLFQYISNLKDIEIGGNILSLIYIDFENHDSFPQYSHSYLFYKCTALISAENLVLPATKLADSCYYSMFEGCTSLTKAPKSLPATILANSCYSNMFYGCTSLTTAPDLPATTLAINCYQYMFLGCTSLTTASDLPATILATGCYSNMFEGCTSLTKAPVIYATKLVSYSCGFMFLNCKKLRYALKKFFFDFVPDGALNHMFAGCISLVKAPIMIFSSIVQNFDGFESMFLNCTSLTDISGIQHTTNSHSNRYARGGDYMFSNTAIEDATNINWVAPYMFYNCKKLKYVKYGTRSDDELYARYSMFEGCTSLLSDNITKVYIYINNHEVNKGYSMFEGCTSLTKVPTIWISELSKDCCKRMFYGCTSLTTLPYKLLPATKLAKNCYQYMFYGCTSLTTLPSNLLPATTLADSCYYSMFYGCTSLTTVPSNLLPATTLADSCYYSMFLGCTSLTKAPDLPATTAASYCYGHMFLDCISLTTGTMYLTTFGDSTKEACTTMYAFCRKLNNMKIALLSFTQLNDLKSKNTNNWLGITASSGIMYVPNTYAWQTETISYSYSTIPSGWKIVTYDKK